MRVKVFLEVTAEDGSTGGAAEVAGFEKQTERAEDLGLSIAEGKALTAAIQALSSSSCQKCRSEKRVISKVCLAIGAATH
jgi:hypothetical protein